MVEQVARDVDGRRDELVERLFGAVLGMNDLYMVYIGERLGFYRALVEIGPATPAELSAAAGTHERYTREWLEQQAVTGILEVEDPGEGATARRYRLPEGHEEVLTGRDSLNYLAPFARMMVGIVRPIPAVLEAFRSGGGVPYAAFDADFCEGQGEMNRAQFVNLLGSEWLPAVPEVHARLGADPPARVADVACGTGWSSLALRAMRGLLVEGGSVIVADERVADSFTAPGDEVERLMYGWSVLHCLPVGMAEQPSAATGTAMRPDTLREYARAAGFRDVEVLPIENDFWRFYRLRP
jgi:hypothetical protein